MKRFLLLFGVMIILIPLNATFSQTLADYISEVKGDTLVVNDYYDMGNQANSLYWVLALDTINVPAGRVYELRANGYYPSEYTPTSYANHPVIITGPHYNNSVYNTDSDLLPPLICNEFALVITHPPGINAKGDLTIKNCMLTTANAAGDLGWAFAVASAPNLHLVFENCLFEHTAWTFVEINDANCNVTFRDCYFVNMDGYPGTNLGGVLDCFAEQDTLLVENCTHIMAQGYVYNFKRFPFKRIIFNHNTFVNCAGIVFTNPGYQNNVSIVNNIFVNCNLRAYSGIHNIDSLEQDPDWEPMGLVNVCDSAKAPIGFYVDKNLAYWDQSLSDIVPTLNSNAVNGITAWRTQMINMNFRSTVMFSNNTKYPYLTNGTWIQSLPSFTNTADLFTTQLANLKTFTISVADTSSTAILPNWRLINVGQDKFVNPDWPTPVDLSYNNPDLMTAGLGGFPVGDLNWFPVQKAVWLAQRDAEYIYINPFYNFWPPDDVEKVNSVSTEFKLQQNYPNPFNPSTTINFVIPKSSFVNLKVYDVLGNEVATLINEEKPGGAYEIRWNAEGLSSGVYLYTLKAGDFVQTKKLVLMK
jgi:Secretion system C-terminal sorting domain/Right handed beta helix region